MTSACPRPRRGNGRLQERLLYCRSPVQPEGAQLQPTSRNRQPETRLVGMAAARIAVPAGYLLFMLCCHPCGAQRSFGYHPRPAGTGSERSHNAAEARATQARKLQQQYANQFDACPTYRYIYSGATMDSIFDELTMDELVSATDFVAQAFGFMVPGGLGSPANAANATHTTSPGGGTATNSQSGGGGGLAGAAAGGQLNTNITQFDSYIYNTFLFPVDKGEALRYLDEGGPLPKRFAKVIAVRGASDPPDTMEYKVGPLPLGPGSFIQPLYKDGQIPYVKRPPNDLPEALALGEWSNAVMTLLKDLFFAFMDQCGVAGDPQCDGNNITAFNVIPPTREDGTNRIATILHYYSVGSSASYDLHNIPFAYKINTTDQDFTMWEVFEMEFCGQGFSDAYALADAYTNGTVRVCKPLMWLERDYSTLWAEDVQQGGASRAGVNVSGPRFYEPAGKRFTLLEGDSNTSRVFQWAGWQGHVTSNPWTGLSFHDLRFKGDRIVYELSLNDQFVAYGGYSTVGQTFYLDAFDQIGGSQYTLRPGYDCPETATYMPIYVMGPYGQQFSYQGSVCFFEQYAGTTSWRHFDYDDSGTPTAAGIKQYEFVVRAIATLGNYDYIISVFFQLDGSIKCQVHMAGYMQALYYDTEFGFSERDLAYGTRVHYNTIGNIHDHLSSWKVDIDVGGTNNTFRVTKVKSGTYDDVFGPGSTPSWALPTDVFKYQDDKLIQTETGYQLDYKEPAVFRFVNENYKNSWGVAKGYGIFHGYTTSQLLPDTHPLTKAAAWSKYHIAVTRRKEEEPTSSKDYYDSHSAGVPIWSLDMALNNESIADQDLVAWVSMGIQHLPRSEDVPLISNVGCEFSIKPVNYFDQLASIDVADSDDFNACAAEQGQGVFDYVYSADGSNRMYDKAGFKVTGPLSSRDVFQATGSTVNKSAPPSLLSNAG